MARPGPAVKSLLGIDIGTGGTKALVVDPDCGGSVLGKGVSTYAFHTQKPYWAEQDPEDWWQAVVISVRQAIQSSGIPPSQISCIGLSGQMQGPVFLDDRNQVLRKVMLWCDGRAAESVEHVAKALGQPRIVSLTGNPLLTGSTASKILWVRENEPAIYEKIHSFLLPKDYVRLRLTGERGTDFSDASATALFDVNARKWSTEMAQTLGVSADWLPSVKESDQVAGSITDTAAEATGLVPGTPVVVGSGDDAASAVGCGAVEIGVVASCVGTSAVLLATSDRAAVDPLMRLDLWCHAMPHYWQVVGAANAAGACLRWLKDTFCELEQKSAQASGTDIYDLLCKAASGVPEGSEGLVFLPHLLGMRTPVPDSRASGAFFGIGLRHSKPHFIRAVLEGVAFAIRDSVQVFKEVGIPLAQVRSIGGGARSALWRQIQADVLGLDHSTVNVSECAAFGAALLAGVGLGRFTDISEACKSTVRVETICAPSKQSVSLYDRSYELYRNLTLATHKISESEANHYGHRRRSERTGRKRNE